jgi:ABC-type sugar transport system ATPase subunit
MNQVQAVDNHVAVLAVRGVSKSFAANRALSDVSLELTAGRITAILGENGAGKSTFIRIASGEMQPDSGEVLLGGELVHLKGPVDAMRRGVFVVHQEPQLVNEMTIAENLFIDELGERSLFALRAKSKLVARAEELLDRLGMSALLPDPSRRCKDISAAERQLVDIVRALSREPRVLFLDEPNSSLSRQETDRLFAVVRELAARGAAIALVSHRFTEVYEMADEIVILRDGVRVASGSVAELPADEAIKQMAGAKRRSSESIEPSRSPGASVSPPSPRSSRRITREPGSVALALRGCSGPGFSDVTFEVRAGEIVGMAGLVGSGRTEIALATIGATQMVSGVVERDGIPRRLASPEAAVRAGIGFISEERRTGVFYDQDIAFNMSSNIMKRFSTLGVVNRRAQLIAMQRLADQLGVRAESVRAPIKSLSGGNQQKVLLARALASDPDVLILDEPTRGVDVATKREIYAILRELATNTGLAVWFISSDLEEVLDLADRVVIVRDGRIADSFEAGPDAGQIVAAALGERLVPELAVPTAHLPEES